MELKQEVKLIINNGGVGINPDSPFSIIGIPNWVIIVEPISGLRPI